MMKRFLSLTAGTLAIAWLPVTGSCCGPTFRRPAGVLSG